MAIFLTKTSFFFGLCLPRYQYNQVFIHVGGFVLLQFSDFHYMWKFSPLSCLSTVVHKVFQDTLPAWAPPQEKLVVLWVLWLTKEFPGRGRPSDWHFRKKQTQSDKVSSYSDLRQVTRDCRSSSLLLGCLCTSTRDLSVHLNLGKGQIHL